MTAVMGVQVDNSRTQFRWVPTDRFWSDVQYLRRDEPKVQNVRRRRNSKVTTRTAVKCEGCGTVPFSDGRCRCR